MSDSELFPRVQPEVPEQEPAEEPTVASTQIETVVIDNQAYERVTYPNGDVRHTAIDRPVVEPEQSEEGEDSDE